MNLTQLDATATARLVKDGWVSPRELVDAALARIEKHNDILGAVVETFPDQARRAAERPLSGPFAGVPILIKDIGATVAGALHSSGLKPLRDAKFKFPIDSHLVTKLREAGFIVIGKTGTSELGILPTAESPAYPPARNPYDTTRSPGGSSGGSASAVAAGLVPVAHGSDGGGSIRIPASCCGLFGLKPSRGRVSFAPHIGDVMNGIVNEHVVARSVRDSAAILDVLAGHVPGDPYVAPVNVSSYLDAIATPPGKLRIGITTRHVTPDGKLEESHPDCLAAVEHARQLLVSLGHSVEHAELTELHDPQWVARFISIYASGMALELDFAGRMLGRPIREDEVETLTWAACQLGRLISAPAYLDAVRWVQITMRAMAAYWERFDLLLTPTLAEPPVPLGTFVSPKDDPLYAIMRAGSFAAFTPPFNATGQPACSVPLHRNAAGLPIGVQFVAAYGREDVLFRLAAQLEAAQPFEHAATRSS
jgi:amidase